MQSYTPLESDSLNSLGVTLPSVSDTAPFLGTTTFLWGLCFSAVILAAFYRYGFAGMLRMEASESTIRKSNEIIKQVTLGLLGVFSMFMILFTINKDMLRGDVGLGELRVGGGAKSVVLPTDIQTGSGGSVRTCESKENVISKLQSPSGICGGTTCTSLSGCNYQQYLSVINSEAASFGVDPKMVIVIMCKESRAIKNSSHKNDNGSYDCGLMQVNQKNECTESSFSATENIRAGVSLIKQKMSSSRVYPNIPAEAGVFATYNCCGNGTPANDPSVDCTASSGFPYTVPKWVCPINPGNGSFNMCSVKSYACELSACMKNL